MTDRCVGQQAAVSGHPGVTLRTPETSVYEMKDKQRGRETFWFYTDKVHAAALD